MPPTDTPIRATDPDEVIEENITASRLNNEYERTLVTEAPEGPPPIRATEVPRDTEHRGADTGPTGYLRNAEDREWLERETLLGPYVGPIDGEGVSAEEGEEIMVASATGGKQDKDGNLIHDPGMLPGHRAGLPGLRDDDGNLIADHDGDGIAAADEGPIRDRIGAGPAPEASEDEQQGSRGVDDADRDLDEVREDELDPAHDPDASEEEQKGGRGMDERDLGDGEDAGQLPEHASFLEHAEVSDEAAGDVEAEDPTAAVEASPGPGNRSRPLDDAPAEEWRRYARANGVTVPDTANKAVTKSALREAGVIR